MLIDLELKHPINRLVVTQTVNYLHTHNNIIIMIFI